MKTRTSKFPLFFAGRPTDFALSDGMRRKTESMSWPLKKKYRERFAREEGGRRKSDGDFLRVCLAFPNHYSAAMSNLGFQAIYEIINHHPSFLCERAFLPDPGDEAVFNSGSAVLFSFESQTPLKDFDIVAFSIPFENDYPNILKMLEISGIALTASERQDVAPLVMAGGFAVSLNPEPVSDFFDIFLLGEGEEMVVEFLDRFAAGRRSKTGRKELLADIQKQITGTYCPGFYRCLYDEDDFITSFHPVSASFPQKIKRRQIKNLEDCLTEQCLMAPGTEFDGIFLVEVSRGCARGCRFCAAGFAGRPARFRSLKVLDSSIEKGLQSGRKIGLLGTAVSDLPDLMEVCRSITDRQGRFSIGSLRLDRLNEEMAAFLRETGAETVALAPEAGSQRLRDVIRKGITEEQIFRAVELLLAHDIVNIRLYFMVGLPTETDDDVESIIELVKRIRHFAAKSSAGRRSFRLITVSINQFIPKAATPFQWCPLEDINAVRKKIRRIVSTLKKEKGVNVIHDLPKWNYIQALMSLGDRRAGKILLAAHRCNGNWPQAMKSVNVNADFYVYREKQPDEILPWDFIDFGVPKEFLRREFKKALASH